MTESKQKADAFNERVNDAAKKIDGSLHCVLGLADFRMLQSVVAGILREADDRLRSAEQAARADGAKQERAAVVAMLRGDAVSVTADGGAWLSDAADAIERADHVQGVAGER